MPSSGGRSRLEKREPRLSVAAISHLGRGSRDIDYPQVIVNRSPQKRLRLAHQATDANACPLGTVAFPCATPSRFSCAGAYGSPRPRRVAKLIQSPPKSVASIGIPCKMRSADLDAVATPALRLPEKKEHLTLTLVKAENLKVAKTLREIELDVLFYFIALGRNFENLRLR